MPSDANHLQRQLVPPVRVHGSEVTSPSSHAAFVVFTATLSTLSNAGDPHKVSPVMLHVLPRSREKSWHQKTTLNCPAWTVDRGPRTAAATVRFEITSLVQGPPRGEEVGAAVATAAHFLQTLLSRIENAAFMWVQDC